MQKICQILGGLDFARQLLNLNLKSYLIKFFFVLFFQNSPYKYQNKIIKIF